LILSLAVLIVVGFLSSMVFTKFDLTEEKRHSLTAATIDMLDNLEEPVFVRCYLHGEFPSDFKRLEQAIRERLDEFRGYSNGMLDYEFIDPYESDDQKTQGENEQALFEQGLRFTPLDYEEEGVKKNKLIWPGAIISYGGVEQAVQFFKSSNLEPTPEMIKSSINNLEYEVASKLRFLMKDEQPKIAFLEGHGELDELEVIDFASTLEETYSVERVRIDGQVGALTTKFEGMANRVPLYDLLVVAKPDSTFNWQDKVLIDQYLMSGGRILWMIDPILTDLDSLKNNQQTFGITNEIGLYDQLFDYGVKLNRDIVIQFECAPIVFDAGPKGNQRNMQMFSWYYSPLIFSAEDTHPVTANLDPIHADFSSSLEIVPDTGLKQSTILSYSPRSRSLKAPVRINSSIVNLQEDYFPDTSDQKDLAVLLEGEFISNFLYRIPDSLSRDPSFAFRSKSAPTKMVVIADGDIAKNKIIEGSEGPVPMPLGYNRYAGKVMYDNMELLQNIVNYLLDDDALISIRSRTILLRNLNKKKVADERSRWQVINVALPLFLVVLFGIIQIVMRKKRFTKSQDSI
jgi:ABC-2 type transport system permease protein